MLKLIRRRRLRSACGAGTRELGAQDLSRTDCRTDSGREISSECWKLIFEVKNDLRICEKLKIISEPSEPLEPLDALNYSTTSYNFLVIMNDERVFGMSCAIVRRVRVANGALYYVQTLLFTMYGILH